MWLVASPQLVVAVAVVVVVAVVVAVVVERQVLALVFVKFLLALQFAYHSSIQLKPSIHFFLARLKQ